MKNTDFVQSMHQIIESILTKFELNAYFVGTNNNGLKPYGNLLLFWLKPI